MCIRDRSQEQENQSKSKKGKKKTPKYKNLIAQPQYYMYQSESSPVSIDENYPMQQAQVLPLGFPQIPPQGVYGGSIPMNQVVHYPQPQIYYMPQQIQAQNQTRIVEIEEHEYKSKSKCPLILTYICIGLQCLRLLGVLMFFHPDIRRNLNRCPYLAIGTICFVAANLLHLGGLINLKTGIKEMNIEVLGSSITWNVCSLIATIVATLIWTQGMYMYFPIDPRFNSHLIVFTVLGVVGSGLIYLYFITTAKKFLLKLSKLQTLKALSGVQVRNQIMEDM
eukprot:TRINITY_DN2846_c0_g1_i2.p1 TRINITY_DN2846_c0_g1~~TRINITY_DN2846_c0_g1_i2.p1  ORF type:complete len:299 (-),score=45.40 TRINITY_DN2846_c0_g1_i2:294-1130(-)